MPFLPDPSDTTRQAHARAMNNSTGFTYIAMLIFVALIGIALAGAGAVWHTASVRDKELELLFVGNEFRQAIKQYAENSPGAQQYPKSLEELLLDRRHPNVRRYLRRMYVDPMTGEADWGLIRRPDGGIVGVHSRSGGRPYKVDNFRMEDQEFTGSMSYSQWRFAPGVDTKTRKGAVGEAATSATSASPPDDAIPVVAAVPSAVVSPPAPSPAPKPPSVSSQAQNCFPTRAAELSACEGSRAEAGKAYAKCIAAAHSQFAQCLRGE